MAEQTTEELIAEAEELLRKDKPPKQGLIKKVVGLIRCGNKIEAKTPRDPLNQEAAKHHKNDPFYHNIKNEEEYRLRVKISGLAALMAAGGLEFMDACKEIIELAEKGLKINPDSAYLLYFRGRSKGDIGLLKEGLENLNKVIKIMPDYADAYVEMGYIKHKIGDFLGAKRYFDKGIYLNPFFKEHINSYLYGESPKNARKGERIYRSILAIRQDGKRTKAFDNAVELTKDVLKKYGLFIEPKNSIEESPLYTIVLISKEFDINKGNTEETMAWNLIKKDIQSIIQKNADKYENIQVYNKIVYDFEPDEISNIPQLARTLPIFEDLSVDELYIGYTFRVITTDYSEIFEIIKSVNRILKLPEVDLKDAEKRYADAIRQITESISRKTEEVPLEISKKIVEKFIDAGVVKTIYDRVFSYKVLQEVLQYGKDYFIEVSFLPTPPGLMRLAKLEKETSRAMSLGIAIATELEPLDQNGYYLTLSDKVEIDPSLLEIKLPT